MKHYNIGDIVKSKFWASLTIHPKWPHYGFSLSIGPTYNMTKAGIVLSFGIGVFIAHIR